jgi:hypothetical protein
MSNCRSPILAFGIAIVALLLVAPAALAAVRYAAPGGGGGEPCNPTPCTLANAVNNAKDGDQVIVTPGLYTPGSKVDADHAIDVGGEEGAATPVIEVKNPEHDVRVENAAAVLHDLTIDLPEPTMGYTMIVASGTVERVYVSATDAAGACQIESGTIRDSVCRGGLSVAASLKKAPHVDLHDITATTTVVLVSGGAQLTAEATNLIAHGEGTAFGGVDLIMDVSAGSSAAVTLSHSNYATVDTTSSSGTNFTYTPPGTNGNQTAPPLFVNAAGGDYRELAGSPTIDAGLADSLTGTADLDRLPRTQPACIGGTPTPDIGAYEFQPTAGCPLPSNAFRFGKLKRNERRGTARLAVEVPGPGKLTLTGKGIAKTTASADRAGTFNLTIKPRGKARRTLAKTGSLKAKLSVSFTPTGGTTSEKQKTIKLLERRRR